MKLTQQERTAFIMILFGVFFRGFVTASFQFQDIVAKKALSALDWQVTMLVMIWPLSNLVSIWWGKLMERSSNIARYYYILGICGRLILIFMFWVKNWWGYMLIMIFVFSFNSMQSPAQSTLFRYGFGIEKRGRLFGIATSLENAVMIIFASLAGYLMDIREEWFRHIFALVAVFGLLSAVFFANSKISKPPVKNLKPLKPKEFFLSPIQRSWEVLRDNRLFRTFEINYFIYGLAFMMILPVIPKFMVDTIGMNYSQMFISKSVIARLGLLFLAPLAGKLHDLYNPGKFSSIAYFVIAFYPLILFFASFNPGWEYAAYFVMLAFLFNGIAMAGINVSWNIGSIYFAGPDEAPMFQSVHVTLTGVRAIFGPLIGFVVMKMFNYQAVLVLSTLVFLFAARQSLKLGKVIERKEIVRSEKT
ncbi:MAG: MFS transporter [Candidatus Cloacimonetes bacterium]|nr:MFS transporter [Candidatus Cloacimonadota bacterium]